MVTTITTNDDGEDDGGDADDDDDDDDDEGDDYDERLTHGHDADDGDDDDGDQTTNTQGEEGSKGSNDAPRSGWDWHAGWRALGLRRDAVLSQCPAIKRGESSEAMRKPESQGGPNGPRGFRGVSSSGDDAPGHASFLLPPAPPPTTPPLPPLHLPFPESIFSPSHLQKNACEIGWVRLISFYLGL